MQALARTVVIIIVFAVLGGITLTYALDIVAMRQADDLARRSNAYAAGDPVGDALAVRAYGLYATPAAIAALQEHLTALPGERQAYIPAIARHREALSSYAAFFNNGSLLAINGTPTTIDIFDARTLEFVRRETLVKPARFLCGLPSGAGLAVADSGGVTIGTLILTLPGITALACAPHGTVYAATGETIWAIDPAARRGASLPASTARSARRIFWSTPSANVIDPGYGRYVSTAPQDDVLTLYTSGNTLGLDTQAWLEALCIRIGIRAHEPVCDPYASEIAPR